MEGRPRDHGVAETPKIVVDASVAVSWFTSEEFSDEARLLKQRYETGRLDLLAPSLLLYELGNALRYNPGFGIEEVTRALRDLEDLQLTLYYLEGELKRLSALLAFTHGLSFYDSAYVALAVATRGVFFTADEEVVRRVSKPFVKHIRGLAEEMGQ